MCGRYGLVVKDARELGDRFRAINTLEGLSSRYNIAPGQVNPVISASLPHSDPLLRREGVNRIEQMFWGLIPSWAKDDSFKFKTINARAEGIENKPVYRKPFRMSRCLVPATGFYEWDKKQKSSQPYYFKLVNDEMFGFAGLFDEWINPRDGREIMSYTIITTQANGVVGKVHPRMPVILRREDEDEWLNPDITEPDYLSAFLKPYPDAEMVSYPVSAAVNFPGRDDEGLIRANSK